MAVTKKRDNFNRKKKKIHLVFDPLARRDFLTGFHKRKLERQKKAKEELKEKMREERKKIRENAKNQYKTMVKSFQSVPEVEHLIQEDHDFGTHSVEIKELSTTKLAEQNNWIGANQIKYDEQEENEEEKGHSEDDSEEDLIPGMNLKVKAEKTSTSTKEEKKQTFKSAKEIKKAIRDQATKQVKKSKVFRMKGKLEQVKNRKKSLQLKRKAEKLMEKGKKGKRLKRKRKQEES